MAGTKKGAAKAASTNKKRHGDTFYKDIGSKGGRNGAGKEYRKGGSRASGFAADPELAREAGAKGGRASRRGPAKKTVMASLEKMDEPTRIAKVNKLMKKFKVSERTAHRYITEFEENK